MLKTITSRDNKIIKTARALGDRRGRVKNGLYIAEGKRLVSDAAVYSRGQIQGIIVTEDFFDGNKDFVNSLDKDEKIVYITNEKLYKEISLTETPQGIAALIELPAVPSFDNDKIKDMSYVLVLDGVSDPGNMGTIIRTAEAAGIECIMLGAGCTDVYGPKTVRSGMGSVFRTKFMKFAPEDIAALQKDGFTVAATALYESVPFESACIKGKRAIVIGNEANGVSDEVLNLSDIRIRIDMCGKVESLNAGVAAGIAMYALRPDSKLF